MKTSSLTNNRMSIGTIGVLDRMKREKKSPAYKKYRINLIRTLKKYGFYEKYQELSDFDKMMVYEFRVVIHDPVCAPGYDIAKRDLRGLGKILRSDIRKEITDGVSVYDFMQMWSFLSLYYNVIDYRTHKTEEMEKEVERIKKLRKNFREITDNLLMFFIYNIMAAISDITREIYHFTIEDDNISEYQFKIGITPVLRVLYQRTQYLNIDGNKRPVYRMPYLYINSESDWNSIDSSLLGESYTGEYDKLDLYIQSHALKRMHERLDIYTNDVQNINIWKNTNNIEEIIFYKDNYLIPYNVDKVRLGYLLAKVVEDKFVITTFLLITHFDTPEGDRFKEVTGLGFTDISYWKLDRMSTFKSFNPDKYPRIAEYLKKAEIYNVLEISKRTLNKDSIKDADFDMLRNYIIKGHMSDKIQEKNIKHKMSQVQQMWKSEQLLTE
ncbi:MAG: hypothetical protein N4A72_16085 [Bacteroidales bacterium]|nr:hypothetical protein [Bacteroidales bacterium]